MIYLEVLPAGCWPRPPGGLEDLLGGPGRPYSGSTAAKKKRSSRTLAVYDKVGRHKVVSEPWSAVGRGHR